MMRTNLLTALLVTLCMVGCGGGGGSSSVTTNGGGGTNPTGSNVQSVSVDSGPSVIANSNKPAVNILFTSVTVCVPGTSTCQTIDHVQVDTGSSGLRIISPVLTLSLPQQKDSGGNGLAECVQFVDGSSWGALRTADVKIAGEVASNQVVQIIGDPAYTAPTACSGSGATENTVASFGANGILGVGPFIQDCGPACTTQGHGVYFSCASSSTCSDTAMPLVAQVSNPVASFTTDNNGIIIEVGAVNGTAATVSGSLIFGIGTQGNNGINQAKVYTLDGNGALTTDYKTSTLSQSFIDSGSNAYYFPDSTIPTCAQNTSAPGFFCPTSTLDLSGTLIGVNQVSATINFSVANAVSLFQSNSTVAAASTLAAPSTTVAANGSSFSGANTFDWGLPFYFGRSVYTAIETRNTSAGLGPYFAF